MTSLLLLHPQVFNLIHSLLLKGLALIGQDDELDKPPIVVPFTLPAFTGTLELVLYQGMVHTARRLLDLPNGLHFRELKLSWCDEEDLRPVVRLVVVCSDTLECLELACKMDGAVYSISQSDQ